MSKEIEACPFCVQTGNAGATNCWSCGKPIARDATGNVIPGVVVMEKTSTQDQNQKPSADLPLDLSSDGAPSEARATKRCPYCAEDIKFEASVCRFCNRDVTTVPPIAPIVPAASLPPVAKAPSTTPPISSGSFGMWGCGCLVVFAIVGLIFASCNPSHNDLGSSAQPTDAPAYNTAPYSPSPEPTPDDSPKLKVMSWSWHREYGYLVAEGEVKNISSDSIAQAQAVVTFMDGNGDMVKTGEAIIEYDPILAGQTSPFKTMATDNPEVKTARLEFKELMGGTIPSIEAEHQTTKRKRHHK